MPSARSSVFISVRALAGNFLANLSAIRPVYSILAGLLLVAMAPSAFAQTGGISGTVRDQRQGAITGAKVSVRNASNQIIANQVTKSDGTYLFSMFPPGTYDVEVQAAGFKISINHGVRVGVGETGTLDIGLTLESVASTVTVQGTAEEGYRVDSVSSIGPLGAKGVLDTPYSFTVVPQAQIQQIQPTSAEQIFEMVPGLQVTLPESVNLGIRTSSRGFMVDTGEDGFRYPIYNIGHVDIEDKDRIELLSGLSGFLYGPMDPGGFANYVLKRPTPTPFAEITLGDYGGTSGYVHADLGGPIDKNGRFGYRLNVVAQGLGDTPVQDQNIKRTLFSGAFDWHITDRLLFQADFSHQDYLMNAPAPSWNFGKYDFLPPPDPTKDWGEPYSYEFYLQNDAGANLTYDISSVFTARLGFKYIWDRNDGLFVGNYPNAAGNDGTYRQFINYSVGFDVTTIDSYGLLDAKFNTGSVSHKVTGGFGSYRFTATDPFNCCNIFFQPGFSLTDPSANQAASQAILANIQSTPIDFLDPIPLIDFWAYATDSELCDDHIQLRLVCDCRPQLRYGRRATVQSNNGRSNHQIRQVSIITHRFSDL